MERACILVFSGETFLRFIVEGLSEARPQLLEVADDFRVLRKNSKGSEIALLSITDDCMKLQQRAKQFKALLDQDPSVAQRMAPMLESSTRQVQDLVAKLGNTGKQFKELCKWLGEDPGTTQPEDVFGWVSSLVFLFTLCVQPTMCPGLTGCWLRRECS